MAPKSPPSGGRTNREDRRKGTSDHSRKVVYQSQPMGPSGTRGPPNHRAGSPPKPALRGSTPRRTHDEPGDVEMADYSSPSEQDDGNDSEQEQLDSQLSPEKNPKLGTLPNVPSHPVSNHLVKAKKIFTQEIAEEPSSGKENNGKDEWLLTGIEELKEKLLAFARRVPTVAHDKSGYLDRILGRDHEELVRYIGCLCLGGRRADWNLLLTDDKAREAIVIGVVARALKEHVFGDYLFGADSDFKQKLQEIDRGSAQHEGFDRTQKRATMIKRYAIDDSTREHSLIQLQHQMIKLLAPLWAGTDRSGRSVQIMSGEAKRDLKEIIAHAGFLAELIRRAPDVVYYWPPTFKDEEFEPGRMEIINLEQMIQDSPYDKVPNSNGTRAVLRDPKKADKSEAIVRIVAFPGIVAYRQYGGSLAHNEIAHEKKMNKRLPQDVRDRYGEPRTAEQGFRSRLISKSVVYLQWGKQRLLTKEAGTSAHLDAVRDGKMDKYTKDSAQVVELYALWQKAHGSAKAGGGRT